MELSMRIWTVLLLILMPFSAFGHEQADLVLVVKSRAKLYLMKNGKMMDAYRVALGANPKGQKLQEGDQRTPEGRYILDYKKEDSAFYKAIHISYPNAADMRRARTMGVDPGGMIMIHGHKSGFEWLSRLKEPYHWTDGCIAVSNSAMDAIWEAVTVGTPIIIRP